MTTQSALIGPNGQPSGSIDLTNRTYTFRDQSTGKLVTMDLAQSDVHIDSALPFYASGYKLQESYADQACPVVVTPKASDYFFAWDKDNAFQQVDNMVAGPGGQIPEVSTKVGSTRFATVEYVLGSFVPTEVEANADAPLKPKMKAMKRIMDAMRIGREQRVQTLLTTSGNWDSTVVLALGATANWNGGVASDPIANIDYIREKSLQPVTGMVMNRKTYNAFRRNPAVQKYIFAKPNTPAMPTAEDLSGSALLDLPKNIYVSDMRAKGKTTGTYDYVWPDGSIAFLHELPGPPTDQESIATAYTFRWSGGSATPDQVTTLNDGSMLYKGWQVREFFDPKRGARGGSMLVVVCNDTEVLTGNVVGGLITGAFT